MKNKGYLRKCKRRDICFYIKDMEIYEKSKQINFQHFVKFCLKNYNNLYLYNGGFPYKLSDILGGDIWQQEYIEQ